MKEKVGHLLWVAAETFVITIVGATAAKLINRVESCCSKEKSLER